MTSTVFSSNTKQSAGARFGNRGLARVTNNGYLLEVGGVFERLFDEIEELGRVAAVGDFVVNRQCHIHHPANAERIGCVAGWHTNIGNSAYSEYRALAGDDNRDERIDAECAEIADGYAAAFEVLKRKLIILRPFDKLPAITGDFGDRLFIRVFDYRGNKSFGS